MENNSIDGNFSNFPNSLNCISKCKSGSVHRQEQNYSSHGIFNKYMYFSFNNNMCTITWVRMILRGMFEVVCVLRR